MDAHDPSYQVVEAVAQAEGVSPLELTPPLFHVVDPQALDRLVRSDADRDTDVVEIEFRYLGYRIRVTSTGEITVRQSDPVRADGGVVDERGFQQALAELIQEAASNDVDVAGGWVGPNGSDGPEYGIEIHEVERR